MRNTRLGHTLHRMSPRPVPHVKAVHELECLGGPLDGESRSPEGVRLSFPAVGGGEHLYVMEREDVGAWFLAYRGVHSTLSPR